MPFSDTPNITLRDPLAELLGAGEEPFVYTFNDAVKLAGHACPTVAGAFLMIRRALELLYPNTIPTRGDVLITVPNRIEEGVTGPITQIFTLVTGAAGLNGFKGLAGQYNRMNLMRFQEGLGGAAPFVFEAISTGRKVALVYSPAAIPPDPRMGEIMPLVLSNRAMPELRTEFGRLWRQRVEAILADGGMRTVTQVG
ncbi:MAG: hypothetical protein HQM01_05735 [Magnetococcales bacterium]|nr:hypothetical protein [Magnetococcales bacterium]